MPRPKPSPSREELDKYWNDVRESIEAYLDNGQPNPSLVATMTAYNGAYNLDTSDGGVILKKKEDGSEAHGVRVRVVKLIIIKTAQENPDEDEQSFKKKWTEIARRIFTYHHRHYVRRAKDEERRKPYQHEDNGILDDGKMTMTELGIEAWRHAKQKLGKSKNSLATESSRQV